MRKFHCDHAVWLEYYLHATYKVVQVRYLCQNIISDKEIGLTILPNQFLSGLSSKELDNSMYTSLLGGFCDVRRRLHTERRNSFLNEVLKKVAIIAC